MTVMQQVPKMTTRELMARLERHYVKPSEPLPGGVFIPECGWNGTGGTSRADALYVGFTSTSGRILIGHEVKVSRADWQHELDQPGKADAWHDQCHQWYVVAPSVEIVPPETVPEGWGLMVPSTRTKTRMQVVVKAQTWRRTPSWDAVRSIMSRQDTLRAQVIGAARQKYEQESRQAIQEAEREARARGLARTDPAGAQALEIVAEVQRRLGHWPQVEQALVVDAIVDAMMVGQVTRQARNEIRSLIATVGAMAEPMRNTARQLAKIEAPGFDPSKGLF
jgi:hypothetical protein